MKMSTVAVSTALFANDREACDLIVKAGHSLKVDLEAPKDPSLHRVLLEDADAYVVGAPRADAELLRSASRLRVIARPGTGVDNIDLETATELGIVVTNAPGVNATSVAELAFGLMLALSRRIVVNHNSIARGEWQRRVGEELSGKTLGVLGAGAVGRELIRLGRAFGMRVVATARDVSPEREGRLGTTLIALSELLRTCDVLAIAAPMTPELARVVRAETLAEMKPTAWIVNTSRGGHIDMDDLYVALSTGRIGGAALDVFPKEPWFDERFVALPNVVLSPHVGGETLQSSKRMARRAAESVIKVLEGRLPDSIANPESWERSRAKWPLSRPGE
jgi:D-3-phosphoglycerate dehydrogenase